MISSLNPDSETENYSEKNELKDKIICLGEYSDVDDYFYLTFIKPISPYLQYHVKSTEKFYSINFCSILNNTNYCISLAQKKLSNKSGIINISTRISFSRYYSDNFVCQETIPEELTYCCYNPKNTIELIICGKGYLRLWNIFINEGALKEHQQRFISGKKEKEHNFIKAQFFEKKSFLLIVGTKENMFYIIDSFSIIHEINMCYSNENIYDLNIQNILNFKESYDIGNLKETIDSLNKTELDDQLKKISLLTNPTNINKESNKNKLTDSPLLSIKEDSNKSITIINKHYLNKVILDVLDRAENFKTFAKDIQLYMVELERKYRNIVENDKIGIIQEDVDDLKIDIKNNIDKMLTNIEMVSTLEEKSNALKNMAKEANMSQSRLLREGFKNSTLKYVNNGKEIVQNLSKIHRNFQNYHVFIF